jgi:hypothetical protein
VRVKRKHKRRGSVAVMKLCVIGKEGRKAEVGDKREDPAECEADNCGNKTLPSRGGRMNE